MPETVNQRNTTSLGTITSSAPAEVHLLSEHAIAQALRELPWLRVMPEPRLSLMRRLTEQAIRSFHTRSPDPGATRATDVLLAAPPELLRSVSLQQTLQFMRVTSSVVEESASTPADREAIADFSRQLVFAAAEFYAASGDGAGLWESRLEREVVDSVRRGPLSDALQQRIRAVGWRGEGAVVVMVGPDPEDGDTDRLRRLAWDAGADVLISPSGCPLVAIACLANGQRRDEMGAIIASIAKGFGAGTVLVGPVVDHLAEAWESLKGASAAASVVAASDAVTRLVAADDLLPERALAGDPLARALLIARVYVPLRDYPLPLLETARHFIQAGGTMKTAASHLNVHANTIRYRMKRVADITGLDSTEARDSFVLQCAMRLGLIEDAANLRSTNTDPHHGAP
jgi:hypothetical protein